jgi:hypothetical protein
MQLNAIYGNFVEVCHAKKMKISILFIIVTKKVLKKSKIPNKLLNGFTNRFYPSFLNDYNNVIFFDALPSSLIDSNVNLK